MKFANLSIKTFLFISAATMMLSCKKGTEYSPMGDAGNTIVRTPPTSGFKLVSIDVASTAQTFGVLDVYRDIPSETALNATTKVVITEDPTVIDNYNTKNNKSYIALPTSSFTIDPSNPKNGNDYTLTFTAGEFYKQLKITVPNSTVLDPNKKYALGFKLASVDNNGKVSASQNTVLVEVGIKNKWDGVYKVTGTLIDLTAPTITGSYPLTWELRTSGSNTVAVYDKSTGTQTHLILSAGSASQYGSYGLNITIDPATNKITNVVNSYGQPSSNGRSAALDPTGVNAYDPATKTIKIKYFLLQPGTAVRTTFDETWVYTGAR